MAELTQIAVPDLSDPLFAPYWAGTAKGELVLPACTGCARVVWPPRGLCPHCGSDDRTWSRYDTAAELYTFTVIGHATVAGFAETPYAVAIVELTTVPGVRMIGSVAGDPDALRIGMPMHGVFDPAGPDGEITVLRWQPDSDKES